MLERPFSPDTRIVSPKERPPVLTRGCDICVIGSGASGISAAVEAARAGRDVILVDGLPSLGGQAVNSIIGMFCGLYTPGKDGRQITHGVADEILHDLGATNDVKIIEGGVMKVAMYNEVALGRWVERTVLAAGVTPLTGAIIRSAPVIDTAAMTAMGKSLSEVLAPIPEGDTDIIRPLSNPISPGPSIAILKGSLAPESAVVKLGIRDGSRPESFDGHAVVYDDSQTAMKDIKAGKLHKGDVLVLRGQGIKGGPAMGGGASLILFAIDAAGLAKDVAFVTDGQLSGLCLKGLTVAEVAPEGATGGPIGKVRNGDRIVIDVAGRRLDLDVPAAELAARPAPGPEFPIAAKGYLGIYRRDVQPMSTGAVLTDLGK